MNNFDILCLSETKIKTDFHLEGFECLFLNYDVKKYPYPGVHGINVFVSVKLSNVVEQIVDSMLCDLALWVKVNNQLILCLLYMPHETSKYYSSEYFSDLASDICMISSK